MACAYRAYVMLMLVLEISIGLKLINAADPDPVKDLEKDQNTFTLRDIFKNGDVSTDSGGVRTSTSIQNFPALRSQGLTIVRFKMLPCGSNLPHTHPRATEVLSVLSGGPLQAGFVDTSGDAHIDVLYPGDVTVFPRGLLHFELNVGTEDAEYISALNSENPGTLTASEALFKLPARTLATALNLNLEYVTAINHTIHRYGPSLKKTFSSGCVPGQHIAPDF